MVDARLKLQFMIKSSRLHSRRFIGFITNILTIIGVSLASLSLAACTNTPNNVNLSVSDGQCVLPSDYSSTVTPPSAIINNPRSAPYCATVTIQNTNSGSNATNVQITNSGMVLSYNAVGSSGAISYNAKLCDNVASGGVCQAAGGSNIVGNVALYDPANCVTTQGGNVATINSGGGSCKFYLQLTNEAYAIGSYPLTLTYNYTNGNNNYVMTTSLNQNVTLFAGGNSGLVTLINNTFSATGISNAPTSGVTKIVHDGVGNVYFSGYTNQVFVFNGSTITQVANTLPSVVNSLAVDNNNVLYVATNANGVYAYNPESAASGFTQLFSASLSANPNASSQILGLAYANVGNTNILYVSEESVAFSCSANSGSLSYNCIGLPTGGSNIGAFYQNSLASTSSATLFAGSTSSLYSFVPSQPSSWLNYALAPTIHGNVYGLMANFATLYAGQINSTNANESSVYSCNLVAGDNTCAPFLSSTAQSISGNVYSLTTDGANNLYVVGSNLSSADFASGISALNGAFIGTNGSQSALSSATTSWQALTTTAGLINNPLQTVSISSSLR